MALHLHLEDPDDHSAIHALTQAAFAPMPYSDGREGPIVDQLRQDGALSLSLVGKLDAQLVAHIAFSPVTFAGDSAPEPWYALGPVSVLPAMQGRGFGRQIIEHGLRRMREAFGAHGIALIGDPALYGRFGFDTAVGVTYGDLDTAYIQTLRFEGPAPQGEIRFAPAFDSA